MQRLLFAILFFLPAGALAAEPLTERQVQNFVTVAEAMEKLEDQYPEDALELDMEGEGMAALDRMFGEDGSLRIMDMMLEKASENPQLERDLTREIRAAGFSSNDEFASVGDRIIVALARSEISDRDLREMQQMQAIPEDQLAMVPPQMRATMEKALMFGKRMGDVPPGDVTLVKKYKDQIEALGNSD